MMQIIDDLASTKQQLPRSIAEIQPSQIRILVKFWRTKGFIDKTIINRLGILRSVNKILMLNMDIPNNHSLNVKNMTDEKCSPSTLIDAESLLEKVYHPITRNILGFQIHFGLTQFEAIYIDPTFISHHNNALMVHKVTAHNNKERRIPILSECQEKIIAERLALCPKMLSEIVRPEVIQGMIRSELLFLNVKTPPDFRSLYAKKRFAELQDDENQAVKTLMREMGITKSKRIYELLAPQ